MFSRSGSAILLAAGLLVSDCSLSLENPDQDAKDKLAKVIPTTMPLLVGRWSADSTYNVDDVRATTLTHTSVILEVLSDTTFSQLDSTGIAFPLKHVEGVFYLGGDTLIIFPLAAQPDTFIVHLRFLGNYLELMRPADQRFTFLHKLKPAVPAKSDSLLKDSLWLLRGLRIDPGIFRPESLTVDFSYLRFSGDSMFADVRRNGIVRLDSGKLLKADSVWTWQASGGERKYVGDLVNRDTLRMWPLADGRTDSGFYLYKRNFGHHPFDIDMRRLIGHLRGDSLHTPDRFIENHYGQYYDWILGEDHKITIETNMKDMATLTAWSLDSGRLAVRIEGQKPQRMSVDTALSHIRLTADSGLFFPRTTVLYQTKVDPARFAGKPLERFEQASYAIINLGGDTTYYFFLANNLKERFEIARVSGDTADWVSFNLNKSVESFQSSQPDFFFAFQGHNAKLGRFTCRSRPYKDLVIRQTVSGDPVMATGLLQGACEVQKADSAFTDSTVTLEGSFKLRRKHRGDFLAPMWSMP